MRKSRQTLIALLLIISMLGSNTLRAETSCQTTLTTCDAALYAADALIEKQKEQVSSQAKLILEQKKIIEKQNKQGLFDQPLFWAVAGGLTVLLIKGR